MRDWILLAAPVAVSIYFAIYSQQLYALFIWASRSMP